MRLLAYTRSRVDLLLQEIERLDQSEFPYPHSRDALHAIRDVFTRKRKRLRELPDNSSTARMECAIALRDLFRFLPLLGFILRSTNVRNSFEVVKPLYRTCSRLLEDSPPGAKELKLILSSEWNYSPVTYPEFPNLPGFVLIGFPAPESSNPLLIPLSGHELGHALWARKKLEAQFSAKIEEALLKAIADRWQDYKATFRVDELNYNQLRTDIFSVQTWTPGKTWAMKQAQEVFSDCVGIKIFGTSFLHAFAYLLAPGNVGVRLVTYPKMTQRIEYMIRAAHSYSAVIPLDYKEEFDNCPEPPLTPSDKFMLDAADEAMSDVAEDLIKEAGRLAAPGATRNDDSEVARIYQRFKLAVPALECKSVVDILNAAWRGFEDDELWRDLPQVRENKESVLRELALKNLEIYEVEQLAKEGGKLA